MSQFKDIMVKGTLRVLKKIITSALEVDEITVTNKINDVPIVDYITRSDIDNELNNESINPIQNKIVKTALDNSASAMNRAIQTKANKSEVYTKTESDHKICKVVCGKNAGAGWFKIGETICNNGKNTVGVTLIINPTYEGSRTSDKNKAVNPTIILTIGARYQYDVVDPDKKIGIKNNIVVKPYDIYGTIFDENCVYVNYENETLSIYLKTLYNSQAYVITALSGYSSYLGEDARYAWTFVDTDVPVELPTTGIGVYATDVTKSKYDSANNVIADTYVIKEDGKGLSTNDFTDAEKQKLAGIATGATNTVVDTALSSTSTNPVQNKAINTGLSKKVDKVPGKSLLDDTEILRLASLENYADTALKSSVAMNLSSIGMSKKNLLKNKNTASTVIKPNNSNVTFTINSDKSVTMSSDGSCTSTTGIFFPAVYLDVGSYILSTGINDPILFQLYEENETTYISNHTVTNQYTLNITESKKYAIKLIASKGTTYNNVTVYPMLRYADITDGTYEPYQDDLQTQIKAILARLDSAGI